MADRPIKLATPRLRVVLNEDDLTAIEVQTINADMVLAERTARKHKWGSMSDSPITTLTFLAWAALRRRGLIEQSVTFEAFEASTASIEDADADDDDESDDDAGRPTRPDPGSG